jgi:hypothetical protein
MNQSVDTICKNLLRRYDTVDQGKNDYPFITNLNLLGVGSLLSPFVKDEKPTVHKLVESHLNRQEIIDAMSYFELVQHNQIGLVAMMFEHLEEVPREVIRDHAHSVLGKDSVLLQTDHSLVFFAEGLDRLIPELLPSTYGRNQLTVMNKDGIIVFSNGVEIFQKDALEINDYYLLSQATSIGIEALVLGDVIFRVRLKDVELANRLLEHLNCYYLETMGISWLTKPYDYQSPYLPYDSKGMSEAILNISKLAAFEDWTKLPASICHVLFQQRFSNQTGFFTEVNRDFFLQDYGLSLPGFQEVPNLVIQGKKGVEWDALVIELRRIFENELNFQSMPYYEEMYISESSMEIPLQLATAPGINMCSTFYRLEDIGMATFKSDRRGFGLCSYVREILPWESFCMKDAAVQFLQSSYWNEYSEEIPHRMNASRVFQDVVNLLMQTAYFRFIMDFEGYTKIVDLPKCLMVLRHVATSNPGLRLESWTYCSLKKLFPSN